MGKVMRKHFHSLEKRSIMKRKTEYEHLDKKINKVNLFIICAGIIAVMAIGIAYSYKLHDQDTPTMSIAESTTIAKSL